MSIFNEKATEGLTSVAKPPNPKSPPKIANGDGVI